MNITSSANTNHDPALRGYIITWLVFLVLLIASLGYPQTAAFEDDFEEISFTLPGLYSDAKKWLAQAGPSEGSAVDVQDGVARVVAAGGDTSTLVTHTKYKAPLRISFDFMLPDLENGRHHSIIYFGDDAPNGMLWSMTISPPMGLVEIRCQKGDQGQGDHRLVGSFNVPPNTWLTAEIDSLQEQVDIKVTKRDGQLTYGHISSTHIAAGKMSYPFSFKSNSEGSGQVAGLRIDNMLIDVIDDQNLKQTTVRPASILKKLHEDPREHGEPTHVVKKVGELELKENEHCWFLYGPEFEAAIEKDTGSMFKLVSLEPTRLDILPLTSNGLIVYVWNKEADWFEIANQVKASEVTETSEGFEIKCQIELSSDHPEIGLVEVVYSFTSELMGIKTSVPFNQEDNSQYEIGVLQAYNKADWDRSIFSAGHSGALAEDINSDIMLRYFDAMNDTTTGPGYDYTHSSSYPQMAIERDDRYFLFGYLDLNTYAYMSPNYLGYMPAFKISPKGTPAGKVYEFDLTYKVFPKPTNAYRDVLRWYLRHVTSSNPLTRDYVRMPKVMPHRTMSPGGLTEAQIERYHIPGAQFGVSQEMVDGDEFYDEQDKYNLDRQFVHVWFAPGIMKNRWPDSETPEAQIIKDEIQRLRGKGYKIYMYYRQFYRPDDFYDDRAPYKKWYWRNKDGITGSEAVGSEIGDFCNPEFVKWYTDDVKRSIDFYQPDGIGWDMSWFDGFFGVCANHPEGGGIHHGILRVQGEVYNWMKDKYPDKSVITNCGRATVSQLYADAIMEEGGWIAPPIAIDATMAFNSVYYFLPYADLIKQQVGKDHYKEMTTRFVMKSMSRGLSMATRGYDRFEYNGPNAQLWQNRMTGMIGSYSNLGQMIELEEFSVMTTCTPIVTDTGAVKSHPEIHEVTASVWANEDRVLVSAFNDTDVEQTVSVEISKSVLEAYGAKGSQSFKFTVLGENGRPVVNETWTLVSSGEDTLLLQGTLGQYELMYGQHGLGVTFDD